MDQLKTATGKVFNCDYFNPFPTMGQCNLRVQGVTLAEVAAVFADPHETVQLWFGETYASGYMALKAIIPEGDAIRVVLGKE